MNLVQLVAWFRVSGSRALTTKKHLLIFDCGILGDFYFVFQRGRLSNSFLLQLYLVLPLRTLPLSFYAVYDMARWAPSCQLGQLRPSLLFPFNFPRQQFFRAPFLNILQWISFGTASVCLSVRRFVWRRFYEDKKLSDSATALALV